MSDVLLRNDAVLPGKVEFYDEPRAVSGDFFEARELGVKDVLRTYTSGSRWLGFVYGLGLSLALSTIFCLGIVALVASRYASIHRDYHDLDPLAILDPLPISVRTLFVGVIWLALLATWYYAFSKGSVHAITPLLFPLLVSLAALARYMAMEDTKHAFMNTRRNALHALGQFHMLTTFCLAASVTATYLAYFRNRYFMKRDGVESRYVSL